MVAQIVPDFDSEQGDLIATMNLEVTKIRQSMFENINVCNKYIQNLDKVVVRINAKHNKQNIMLELVQKQIDQRKREHEDFTKRIQICDLEIEILKDYEYGLVERIALPNIPTE
jgi:hypothetical protein